MNDAKAFENAPQIGQDEWARSSVDRTERRSGLGRLGDAIAGSVPWHVRLLAALAVAALIPAATNSSYILTVGVNTLLLTLLCLGLNVTVGWSGLLDLGYMAFYGLGAYLYSLLSSDQLDAPVGIHLPTLLSIPTVVVLTGVVGLLIGLSSSRVADVYLALFTLFFAEIFLQTVSIVALPISGGPYGITDVDPLSAFGSSVTSVEQYYVFTLVCVAALVLLLKNMEGSRIGRAWRAVREDEFVSSFATVPPRRVKIYAFVFGSMVAAFAGCVFAAFEAGTYPTDFGTAELFLIYAALILGGIGSIGGAIVGAVLVSVGMQLLQSTTYSTGLFFAVVILALIARLRPWRNLGLFVVGEVAFGLLVHAVVVSVSNVRLTVGAGLLNHAIGWWLVKPALPRVATDWVYVALLGAIVAVVIYPRLRRLWLLVPGLYFAAFAWVTVLVPNSNTTSELLLGGMLIVVMTLRPRGLLGTMPKEIAK